MKDIVYIISDDSKNAKGYTVDKLPEGYKTTSKSPGGRIKPIFDFDLVEWVETATPQEIQINNLNKAREEIKSKYEFHKKNGWDAYQNFRSQIVIDINTAKIDLNKAFEIEGFLKVAFNKISNTGDWKTAHSLLSQLTTEDTVIKEYKDKALIIINEYIINNYD